MERKPLINPGARSQYGNYGSTDVSGKGKEKDLGREVEAGRSHKPRSECKFRPTYGEMRHMVDHLPEELYERTCASLTSNLKRLAQKRAGMLTSRSVAWDANDYEMLLSSFQELAEGGYNEHYLAIVAKSFKEAFLDLSPDEQLAVRHFVRKMFDHFGSFPSIDEKMDRATPNMRELHDHFFTHVRLVNKIDIDQWDQLDAHLGVMKTYVKKGKIYRAVGDNEAPKEFLEEMEKTVKKLSDLVTDIRKTKQHELIELRCERVQKMCAKLSEIVEGHAELKKVLEKLKNKAALTESEYVNLLAFGVNTIVVIGFVFGIMLNAKSFLENPALAVIVGLFLCPVLGSCYLYLPYKAVRRSWKNAAKYEEEVEKELTREV